MTKKTKIVATIGPATESKEMLQKLVKAGMNVMRLNFSHGDFAEHQRRVDNLRKVMKETGQTIGILQDLGGPKIRLGEFYAERVHLKAGDIITITTKKIVGDEARVSINYEAFPKEVKVGDRIMVDDGKKMFQVVSVNGDDVLCEILVGGETKGRRGVNLPDSDISIKALTDKDKKDVEFGVKNKVDFIALSFVRNPSDIAELRAILQKKKSDAGIIAKIETPKALENIDEIIRLSDGVMIARGDLAIEVPFEKVPVIQKMVIEKCIKAGKPVITATQMLESMIQSPVATRAEVSDIANAILDGTDAIMLSEETTLGKYPIEAVLVMAKIAQELETDYPERIIVREGEENISIADSVTGSVVKTAHDVNARVIVALTESGFTARIVSRHRPKSSILAMSGSPRTSQKLTLSFGCIPVTLEKYETLTDVYNIIRTYCLKERVAKKGDRAVVVAGASLNKQSGGTNMLLVETL